MRDQYETREKVLLAREVVCQRFWMGGVDVDMDMDKVIWLGPIRMYDFDSISHHSLTPLISCTSMLNRQVRKDLQKSFAHTKI